MKWKNEKKVHINAVFQIEKKDATIEEVFEQVYNSACYEKWFNFKPFVWLTFDQKHLDIGCKGVIRFTIPPFQYELTVVNVVKNELIELSSDGKLFQGTAKMRFYEKDGMICYEDPHILYGKNILVHKYYCMFLAGKHVPYMKQRFEKLKAILINKKRKICDSMRTRFDFCVRGYELDSFGHVNNAVYLNYMEEARWKMMREIFECNSYIMKQGLFPAVIETNIKYIRELTAFSDAYILTDWGYLDNYLIANHKIYTTCNHRVVAKATVKMLLLSKERIVYELPEEVKKILIQT